MNRSMVLRMGLDYVADVADSVWLSKAVVELANEKQGRVLLHRAVECYPWSYG